MDKAWERHPLNLCTICVEIKPEERKSLHDPPTSHLRELYLC
jgi:hypothetical protein